MLFDNSYTEIMKTLSLASIAFLTILSTNANAAEFGPYFGANINQYNVSADRNIISGDLQPDNTLGGGVRAGYNISLLGLFIAPEIYADYIGLDSYETSTPNRTIDLNYQFGGKVNAGISILGIVDTYVTAGINYVDYNANWNDSSQSKGSISQGYMGGLGVNFSPPFVKLLSLNLEANLSNQQLDSPDETSYDTDIITIKLGLNYHF